MPSPVPRTGNLSVTSPCELLASLCREGETGILTVHDSGPRKSVYLQKGRIVFATSEDPEDRLGEFLLMRGVITREQLERASARVRPGKRLGTVLVEMEFLPPSDLPRWIREQVKEIVFSLFSWGEGEYRFEAGPLPGGEVITLRISSAEIFLTGLRRVQKWSVLRKGAGEIQIPYRLAPNYRQLLKEVQLGQEEDSLLLLVESGSSTMEQAARNSTLSTLLVYQLYFAFRVLGVLLPTEKSPGPRRERGAPSRPTSRAAREGREAARPGAAVPASPEWVDLASPPAAASSDTVSPEPPPPPRGAGSWGRQGDTPGGSSCEASDPAAAGGRNGERTGQAPDPSPPREAAGTPSPSPSRPAGTREYQIVRVDGERLDGDGAPLIAELLGSWSGKGFSLAGVVQGKPAGEHPSPPPSFFIFVRD